MCATMYERVPMLTKKNREIPSDMVITLHTLLYSAGRSGVDELETIGKTLTKLYGKKFAAQTENDEKCVHELIRNNINFITPEEGWKVKRLMEIAREVNQPYTPSEKELLAYKKYMMSKGELADELPNPPPHYHFDETTKVPGQISSIPVQPVPKPIVQPGPYSNYCD